MFSNWVYAKAWAGSASCFSYWVAVQEDFVPRNCGNLVFWKVYEKIKNKNSALEQKFFILNLLRKAKPNAIICMSFQSQNLAGTTCIKKQIDEIVLKIQWWVISINYTASLKLAHKYCHCQKFCHPSSQLLSLVQLLLFLSVGITLVWF